MTHSTQPVLMANCSTDARMGTMSSSAAAMRESLREVGCRDASAVVVNGVYYGSACVPRTAKRGSANPPCGKMALIPEPSGCGIPTAIPAEIAATTLP